MRTQPRVNKDNAKKKQDDLEDSETEGRIGCFIIFHCFKMFSLCVRVCVCVCVCVSKS